MTDIKFSCPMFDDTMESWERWERSFTLFIAVCKLDAALEVMKTAVKEGDNKETGDNKDTTEDEGAGSSHTEKTLEQLRADADCLDAHEQIQVMQILFQAVEKTTIAQLVVRQAKHGNNGVRAFLALRERFAIPRAQRTEEALNIATSRSLTTMSDLPTCIVRIRQAMATYEDLNGSAIPDSLVQSRFLESLPSAYESLVERLKDDHADLETVFDRVSSRYKTLEREGRHNHDYQRAFHAEDGGAKCQPRPCKRCRSTDHDTRDCPQPIQCFCCDGLGHSSRRCPYKKYSVAAAQRSARQEKPQPVSLGGDDRLVESTCYASASQGGDLDVGRHIIHDAF